MALRAGRRHFTVKVNFAYALFLIRVRRTASYADGPAAF